MNVWLPRQNIETFLFIWSVSPSAKDFNAQNFFIFHCYELIQFVAHNFLRNSQRKDENINLLKMFYSLHSTTIHSASTTRHAALLCSRCSHPRSYWILFPTVQEARRASDSQQCQFQFPSRKSEPKTPRTTKKMTKFQSIINIWQSQLQKSGEEISYRQDHARRLLDSTAAADEGNYDCNEKVLTQVYWSLINLSIYVLYELHDMIPVLFHRTFQLYNNYRKLLCYLVFLMIKFLKHFWQAYSTNCRRYEKIFLEFSCCLMRYIENISLEWAISQF